MVVITRNVDLSVGSIARPVRLRVGQPVRRPPGDPDRRWCSWSASASGWPAGWSTGCSSPSAGCPALVVTLGTLYIIRGIDSSSSAAADHRRRPLPRRSPSIPRPTRPRHPVPGHRGRWSCSAVGAYYLRSYRSGRDLYAIGSNPDAARLAGIPVRRRVLAAFVSAARSPGLAGVLWAARFGTVDANAATGYELQVIAAVVVGGVAIFGGSGTRLGAALGALLLPRSAGRWRARDHLVWQDAISGFLLLLAISSTA